MKASNFNPVLVVDLSSQPIDVITIADLLNGIRSRLGNAQHCIFFQMAVRSIYGGK